MANSKKVSSFFVSKLLNKFEGTSMCRPKTVVASFHSSSWSSRQKLFNRGRSVYDKITNPDDALKLFHEMALWRPLPSVARFAELLQAATAMRDYSCLVELFQGMNGLGVPVNARTTSIVIQGLCQTRHTKEGFAVVGYGYKRGVVPDVCIFSTLLDGLIREGKIHEAETFFRKRVIEEGCKPTAVMYLNMIKGLCYFGLNDAAIALLNLKGRRGFKTTVAAYGAVIESLCKVEMVDDALKLFRELVFHKKLMPDNDAIRSLLDCLCELSRGNDISKLFEELEDSERLLVEHRPLFFHAFCKLGRMVEAEDTIDISKPNLGVDVYESLIEGYCSLGRIRDATQYFDLLKSEINAASIHLGTYNSLLKCYFTVFFDTKQAICLYDDMIKDGVKPNVITNHIMLKGLFEYGDCARAQEIFNEMLANSSDDFRPNLKTYDILFRGLCTHNKVDEAVSVFNSIGENERGSIVDAYTYNILIEGAINSGKLDMAWNLFNDLATRGVRPNGTTYALMINGLCMKGLVDDAKQLFLEMKKKGVQPNCQSCDLLLRGFLQNEQLDIVETVVENMVARRVSLDEDTKSLIHAEDRYLHRLMHILKRGAEKGMMSML